MTYTDEEEPSTTIIPRHVMTFQDVEKPRRICTSPVHGLICYSVKRNQHVICNLATRQLFHLPRKEEDFDDEYLLLGYEPTSNRFKVISILNRNAEQQCWIFTVGDGVISSWRKIDDIPYYPLSSGVCINGVLYYEALIYDDDATMLRVVSFDLKTENFNLIELPPDAEEVLELIDFQGKLAFVEFLEEIRVWVLENAEKHEWSSKSYNLPLTLSQFEIENIDVVGICEGEIVFIQLNGAQVYTLHFDLEKKTTRKVGIKRPSNYYNGNGTYFSVNHFDNIVML